MVRTARKWIRKYWIVVLVVAAFLVLEVWIVRSRAHEATVKAYEDADTLSEIAFYDADNTDLYVNIMSATEFANGGFLDYSEELFTAEPVQEADEDEEDDDDDDGEQMPDYSVAVDPDDPDYAVTHKQRLFLFLPYQEGDRDWRLGIADGVVLRIDAQEYRTGDPMPALAAGSEHVVEICDADGALRERGTMSVRYTGNVPVLAVHMEDTDDYKEIRFTKHVQKQADWFCLDANGKADSYGTARLSGHGNSSYDYAHKKPMNLRLDSAQSILGMSAIEKYVLLANSMDTSNLKDMIVYEAARRLGMENVPECAFVCYYLNGEYQGLYLLSQKVDIGKGNVTNENDLDSDAKDLNKEYPAFTVDWGALDTDHSYAYFNVANTPVDYSGAYLLELQMPGYCSDYVGAEDHVPENDGAWLRTDVLDMLIRSPKYASKTETEYIRELVLEAEDALYAEDGVNPMTGKSYAAYYDVDSWGALVLVEDFFALQDYSLGSIFVLKRQGDDTLYAGPIWDYDKALTDDYYGMDEYRFAMDGQTGLVFWMYQFSIKEEIRERMQSLYVEWFSDIMMQMIGEDIPAWMEEISSAAAADDIRWGYEETLGAERANEVYTWCVGRTAWFNGVWVTGDIADPDGRIWGKQVDHNGKDISEPEMQ